MGERQGRPGPAPVRLPALLASGLLAAFGGCMSLSTPFDVAINLGTFRHVPELQCPDDGVRRLVVLRHGMWRSAASLWKLERALRDHGYETLNESYASTSGTIEDHARDLAGEVDRELDRAFAAGDQRPVELHFVGHSMGGLVIRRFLSMPGVPVPTSCVFIATPHRGAILTDRRRHLWMFRFFLGDEASRQLSPSDPFYAGLRRLRCDCGVIFGGVGDGVGYNDDIPGDDDGTVGVDEAQLPEAKDRIWLRLGHTRIGFDDQSVRQVLHFLKHRRFDHGAT